MIKYVLTFKVKVKDKWVYFQLNIKSMLTPLQVK